MLKAAVLDGHLENYASAIEKFESVAQASLENNLTKWSVRDYLLKAGICILCSDDHVRAHIAFDERYPTWDMTFSDTREAKFLNVCPLSLSRALTVPLQALLAMTETSDVEGYTDTIVEFDKLSKLDAWKTTLLLRVKKTLVNEEMDFT